MIIDVVRYGIIIAIVLALLFSGYAAWHCARILSGERRQLILLVISGLERQATFMARLYAVVPDLDENEHKETMREIKRELADIRDQLR